MSKKGQRKIGQCIYCGNVAQISKDHVIPKSLFVRPLPSNLITVPCCDSCNNNKSQNDDFLRDLLTTDVFGNQHPTAQQIFQEKVLRSNERNSSTIAKIVSKEARTEPFYTRKGICLGNIITAPIEPERVKTIFTTIIRGLYFDARHQRIPDSYDFEIRRFYPWEFNEVWQNFQKLHINGPRLLGSTFGCAFLSAQEDPFTTFWLLWFYQNVFFSVSAENPELRAE